MRRSLLSFVATLVLGLMCQAQEASSMNMPGMGDMQKPQEVTTDPFIRGLEAHTLSGTDVQPDSASQPMLMWKKGSWTWMLHGEAFVNDIQQSGPRGADKFFSTNWLMPMAQRRIGRGALTLRTMLSLEPATVSERQYPELFQQGETAFGRPIVDGQHPHNFFMEMAAIYDYRIRENALLSLYVAPVGDPALGPAAYPHRLSASENPVAPLGHHLEDSTHISDEVITAAIAYKNFRVEGSGFHGREPDEFRWDIDSGRIDSWSTRVTFNPGRNWSMQYSVAQLTSPEALFPHENVRRMTASLMYNRQFQGGNWASMLLWGRNQSLDDGNVGDAFLLESTLRFLRRNNIWTRIENVDRTNELLLGENFLPANFMERYFVRVQAYTLGYDRELGRIPHISAAVGAQFTTYGVPSLLTQAYGRHPMGVIAFLRLRAE
jgi:hypothetical protein